MEEFDAVAKNAAQLNDIYDTPTTNALVVAVAALREELESPLAQLQQQLIEAVVSYVSIERQHIQEHGKLAPDKRSVDLETVQQNMLTLGDAVLTERLRVNYYRKEGRG